MKGVKGKLLKRLKSIKPIGYLKPDRILQVNAADGFVEALPKIPFFKAQSQVVSSKEPVQEKVKESCVLVDQEPEVIDVTELMRDLEEEEEEEEEEEMEVEGEDMDDKENVRPRAEKGRDQIGVREKKELSLSSSKQTPLSEIDALSFRRPDLNSGSLFDPNLLAAFEEAVKEHMRISEEERQARIERENIERRLQEAEKQGRILAENVGTQEEEEEPPLKARRIEKEEEEEEDDDDVDPLIRFPEKCPPGGSDSVVLYSTTLRGIRKTFEDCNSIRFLLESFRVVFLERDVSMHTEFKEELWRVLDGKVMPPRLFIKGRYVGGAEEVLALHEQGKLRVLFEGIPIDQSVGPCEGCAGVRFVLCSSCRGSHRVVADDGSSSQCQICNENGLIICPLCC